MASSRILAFCLGLQGAAPFVTLAFEGIAQPPWIVRLVSAGFFALALGVWREKILASRLSMWAMALQVVHISHEKFASQVYFGGALGVFYLPDKAPWYDAMGLYRSVGFSAEMSLSHGIRSLQTGFNEEGTILALNLVAVLLLVGFLKNLERLEEASERKSVEAAGKAESPGTGA